MKQLIFVVETNKVVKTDEIYIKSILNSYYDLKKNNNVKVQFVYMNGKTKYQNKKVIREINHFVTENKNGDNIVIYCFDTDRIDNDADEKKFFDSAMNYCKMKNYELIWFCYTIENVFLGRIVKDKEKRKESITYAKKEIDFDETFINNLSATTQTECKSNILSILNKYLSKNK